MENEKLQTAPAAVDAVDAAEAAQGMAQHICDNFSPEQQNHIIYGIIAKVKERRALAVEKAEKEYLRLKESLALLG